LAANTSLGMVDVRKVSKEVRAQLERCGGKCYTMTLLLTGFSISIGLVNATKWLYVSYSYKHALFLTATHMIASYALSAFAIFVLRLVPDRRILDLSTQVKVVAPFSLLGAASLGAANLALVNLYPSFHQMLQNTTPFWTAVCAIVMQGKRFNRPAYLALVPVCLGGVICTLGERSEIRFLGVLLSLSSAGLRAARATVQAELLKGEGNIDSITLLYYSSPFNLALFLCGSLVLEGAAPWVELCVLPFSGLFWILAAAVAAASYNLVAFFLARACRGHNIYGLGQTKTPATILACVLMFGNQVTLLQLCGFSVTLGGVYFYDKYAMEVDSTVAKRNMRYSPVASTAFGLSSVQAKSGEEVPQSRRQESALVRLESGDEEVEPPNIDESLAR